MLPAAVRCKRRGKAAHTGKKEGKGGGKGAPAQENGVFPCPCARRGLSLPCRAHMALRRVISAAKLRKRPAEAAAGRCICAAGLCHRRRSCGTRRVSAKRSSAYNSPVSTGSLTMFFKSRPAESTKALPYMMCSQSGVRHKFSTSTAVRQAQNCLLYTSRCV